MQWALASFEVSIPWADIVGDGSFGQRAPYPTSVSIQARKPWFGSGPYFLFRQRCNAFFIKAQTSSVILLPSIERQKVGVFCSDSTFFKCSPAILHSDKDLKIQVTLRIVILTAQVSKQQSTGQYNETGLSDSSEVSIKFQSLSQQYWQAR